MTTTEDEIMQRILDGEAPEVAEAAATGKTMAERIMDGEVPAEAGELSEAEQARRILDGEMPAESDIARKILDGEMDATDFAKPSANRDIGRKLMSVKEKVDPAQEEMARKILNGELP
eukprot:m.481425 g.481425  ORF g.481425 m.481425 type:complete len:118 (-) comp22165_c0_seq1:270-623(-)